MDVGPHQVDTGLELGRARLVNDQDVALTVAVGIDEARIERAPSLERCRGDLDVPAGRRRQHRRECRRDRKIGGRRLGEVLHLVGVWRIQQ